jgi:hypothetical protein
MSDATMMSSQLRARLSDDALDQLFRNARTHNEWLPKAVPADLLRQIYDLARFGPTSANSSPARFVFLTSPKAKERLRPALAAGNLDKTMAAPVTAIIAYDTEFHEKLPKLFPHRDMRSAFSGNSSLIEQTAFRNGTLQGGYFILAARSALTAARCRASTPRRSMLNFSPTAGGRRTSSATSAMETRANCSRAARAFRSKRRA